MWKKNLALCGLILFLGGVGVGVYAYYSLVVIPQQAIDLTDECLRPYVICNGFAPNSFSASLTKTHIHGDQTTILNIDLLGGLGADSTKQVTAMVSLVAPDFSITPSKTDRRVTFVGTGHLSWALTPTQLGAFQVRIETHFTDPLSAENTETEHLGIAVTSEFGLSDEQVTFLALLGSILGPVLVLPGWVELWKKQKQAQKAAEKLLQSRRQTPLPILRDQQLLHLPSPPPPQAKKAKDAQPK